VYVAVTVTDPLAFGDVVSVDPDRAPIDASDVCHVAFVVTADINPLEYVAVTVNAVDIPARSVVPFEDVISIRESVTGACTCIVTDAVFGAPPSNTLAFIVTDPACVAV
jgi:hypothetical protein